MISSGTLRSVIEYGLPLPFSYNSYVGDSVRIRHLRFSTITHASVSRAREARLTAFVTQSGDVFNEDARLTIESSAKTPAVVVGRSRGRVAQRERVCRGERRTEVELIDRTTPYNSAPRRGLFYAAGGRGGIPHHELRQLPQASTAGSRPVSIAICPLIVGMRA